MEIIWSQLAKQKINAIVDYIALDDPITAENWVVDVLSRIDQLIDYPESGRVIPEYNQKTIRELVIGNYRVFYRIREDIDAIFILSVWNVRQIPT